MRGAGGILGLLAVALLTACGTLPATVERPVSAALTPSPDSPLVRIAQTSTPDLALTGFRLMPVGFYSLDARIQLANRARHSLDVQYYLIANDRTGRLVLRTLRDAALRGVRVRLLVDDLYTVGADAMFRNLAMFPNVEVRLFNPFCCGRDGIASKYLASLPDFGRLNHRMHNKLFIADGAMTVMGGRNIADEYFTRSATGNFVDMDILVVGSAVDRLAGIFDEYWNSRQAYPVQSVVQGPGSREEAQRDFDRLVDDGEQMKSLPLSPVDILGYGPIGEELDEGRLGLVWGTAVAFADQPEKVTALSAEAARSMSVQMDIMDRIAKATGEVVISSPYFVPRTFWCAAVRRPRKAPCEGDGPHKLARCDRRAGRAHRLCALPRRAPQGGHRSLRAQPDAHPQQRADSATGFVARSPARQGGRHRPGDGLHRFDEPRSSIRQRQH
jgi:putative cardiolipin synthase